MIQQTLMPIKIERMEPRHTARGGLFFYAEFMRCLGVERWILEYMPHPESGRGFSPLIFIKPISMMLYGGGQCIDDIKEIKQDKAIRKTCGLSIIPSSSTTGDWLKRTAQRGGIEGMEMVNRETAQAIIKKDKRKKYTLIVDPTIIEAEKKRPI